MIPLDETAHRHDLVEIDELSVDDKPLMLRAHCAFAPAGDSAPEAVS